MYANIIQASGITTHETLILTVIIQLLGFAFSYGIIVATLRGLKDLPNKVQDLSGKVIALEIRQVEMEKKLDFLFNLWNNQAIGKDGYLVEYKGMGAANGHD